MKRVLVTGGSGFIGSFLCEKLINEGHEVIAIDNFFTGKKRNLKQIINKPNFKLIHQDVEEPIKLEIEWIFNLACPASPIHYQSNPIKTSKTNVIGILNMLEMAKKNNACLLQASTSEVYGDPLEHPQNENYFGNVNPTGIRSCYDEGKRMAETLVTDYNRINNVDTKIVRIFNTYGPRMNKNDGRVVSNFIVSALKGEPITIHGDGLQSRCFCYVTELIDGILKMMKVDNFKGPVNLGNPVEYSIKELAEKIIDMTNSRSKLIYSAARSDDPVRRKPDIKLARQKLGWEPQIKLEIGLQKTIDYFEKILTS
tara:strand:+ start:935 stop:1870 length:936 start_codon:yes stop_codon:yes gene_type:complete